MEIWIVVGVIVGLVVGAAGGWWAGRRASDGGSSGQDAADVALLTAQAARAEAAEAELRTQVRTLTTQNEQSRRDLDAARQSGNERFQQLVEENRRRVEDLQREHHERLDALQREQAAHDEELAGRRAKDLENQGRVLKELAPVQERLATMQRKITDLEQQRQEQYGSLKEQMTQAQRADEILRDATTKLAGALQSNATRGAWGETQLRNIVESAGLIPHVDFDTQVSITTEDQRQRPDMVLHLPGNKSVPVDSKAPFNAYMQASAIPPTASDEELARRRRLLDEHVAALKKHIDALAGKQYWKLFASSPEFVVAFIPNESLLSAALEQDPTLLEYAFQKRVALASPVTLWAVLKTIGYAWQQQELTDQAKELFDLSRELYERLGTMAEHADKLRRSIEQTVTSYNKFASSLEHRVLVTGRKLQRIDSGKVIPEIAPIDTMPQALSAPELDAPSTD
ncbi:MAG: DNA recombination protein RmuC [Pseudoclavibacter sp.]